MLKLAAPRAGPEDQPSIVCTGALTVKQLALVEDIICMCMWDKSMCMRNEGMRLPHEFEMQET